MTNCELIKNEVALDYSFQPKQLPFREKESYHIINYINNFKNWKDGTNILVYGYPDIGKSHAVKSIIQDYEEKNPNVFVFYINCRSKNASSSIIMEISDILGYKKIKNSQTSELFDKIKKTLSKKNSIFIFDGIENLIDFQILEAICKSLDRKIIMLITELKEFFDNIDERIKSVLNVENIEFKPYDLIETRKIFKQRMDLALYKNIMDNQAFDFLTKKSFETGNIKIGLLILRKACIEAETKSLNKITKSDIQRIIDNNNTESQKFKNHVQNPDIENHGPKKSRHSAS